MRQPTPGWIVELIIKTVSDGKARGAKVEQLVQYCVATFGISRITVYRLWGRRSNDTKRY